jgi:hypothetical protein
MTEERWKTLRDLHSACDLPCDASELVVYAESLRLEVAVITGQREDYARLFKEQEEACAKLRAQAEAFY